MVDWKLKKTKNKNWCHSPVSLKITDQNNTILELKKLFEIIHSKFIAFCNFSSNKILILSSSFIITIIIKHAFYWETRWEDTA